MLMHHIDQLDGDDAGYHMMPPIDRSQPPLMTVSVTPKARISRIDVELSMSSRLYARVEVRRRTA